MTETSAARVLKQQENEFKEKPSSMSVQPCVKREGEGLTHGPHISHCRISETLNRESFCLAEGLEVALPDQMAALPCSIL